MAQSPVEIKDSLTTNKNEKQTNSYELFPQDQLYPSYLANPLRSMFSVQMKFIDESAIANTGNRRFDLKIGGRLGIFRVKSSQREWQLTLEGGFHGLFDIKHSEDNIGWDGIYALSLDVRENEHFTWRVGTHHISSHIGDELVLRTGRTRINYTRQELRAGAAWQVTPEWLTYAEIARAYDINNKVLQKHWRKEVGIQYEKRHNVFYSAGFYAGLDLSSYEENNWDINKAAQFGLVFVNDERHWRLGLEIYDGRVQIGEFFRDKEKYIGLGFWVDI